MNPIKLALIRCVACIASIVIGFILENITRKIPNTNVFFKGVMSILYMLFYMLGTGCFMFFVIMYFLIFVGLGVC